MGIYVGDAPLYEVNGHVLTYDEYQFWLFMGKPAPLQFARQLLVRERLQLSQQNTNKQTPRPDVLPPSQQLQQPPRTLVAIYEGDAKRIEVYSDGSMVDVTPASTGPTTRLVGKCPACGDTLPIGAKFCISCGELTHAHP